MKRDDFHNMLWDDLFPECTRILREKGSDYSGDDDVFAAIMEDAGDMEMSPKKVLGLFYNKHHKAIMRWLKDEKLESEAIEFRLIDAINFLSLMYAFHKEFDIKQKPGEENDSTRSEGLSEHSS